MWEIFVWHICNELTTQISQILREHSNYVQPGSSFIVMQARTVSDSSGCKGKSGTVDLVQQANTSQFISTQTWCIKFEFENVVCKLLAILFQHECQTFYGQHIQIHFLDIKLIYKTILCWSNFCSLWSNGNKVSVGLGDGLASNTWQAITQTINDQAMVLKPNYSGRVKSIP